MSRNHLPLVHNVAEVGQYQLRKILLLRDVCVDAGVPSVHAMTSTEVVVEEDRVAGGSALDIKVDDVIAEYAGFTHRGRRVALLTTLSNARILNV